MTGDREALEQALGPTLIAAARTLNAGFFLVTALYCLLTYSPFAYQQFIRPHLVQWLAPFIVWHHIGFWVVLGITAVTMLRELKAGRGAVIGGLYLTASTAVGVALLAQPILPQVENDGRGLLLALAALVFPIWLAAYDHRVTSGAPPPRASSEARAFRATLAAGLVVWAGQTAAAPWRLQYTGEITLSASGLALGAATSALAHLLVFTLIALVLVTVLRAARLAGAGSGEYVLLVLLAGAAAAFVFKRFVFGAISFHGPAAWVLALQLGATVSLLWSGTARRRRAQRAIAQPSPEALSAFDVWLLPLPGGRSRLASFIGALALGAIAVAVFGRVMTFDWDFVLQRLCVIALWAAAFGYAYGVVTGGSRRLTRPALAAAPVVAVALTGVSAFAQPRMPQWLGEPRFVPEFVLQGYTAVDPSFRFIRDLLHVESTEDAAFYQHLRAHSNIRAGVEPVQIDYARPLNRGSGPRPNIFLIVIDSLRRDYLQPYNDAADFTPAIAAFAAESAVFERAFSRYGGTGLSMPAMWAGGMVLHKQYVTPFAPMNTLAKLLDAERYIKVLSPDHITMDLLGADARFVELDRGVPEMAYDVCRTLDEMLAFEASSDRSAPLFAHTRSLNLHIAHVRNFPVPAGTSYAGFLAPVAASVSRIDGCFGRFIAALKRRGLYDNSIVVLTSDHGDSLGERLAWGHALSLYPEVLRIPLIVHLPPSLGSTFVPDTASAAFLTDLAPTFYELLGHTPTALGPLFGRPLVAPVGSPRAGPAPEAVLVGSSYGAVYGVLRENGRKLYIADGINGREYAYDMSQARPERVGITAADRALNRTFIRQQLEALADLYKYRPSR